MLNGSVYNIYLADELSVTDLTQYLLHYPYPCGNAPHTFTPPATPIFIHLNKTTLTGIESGSVVFVCLKSFLINSQNFH
jgi:hypothetical protein